VTEQIQALIRSRSKVDSSQLADSEMPLERLAGSPR
jgi:hypothetical protein